MVNISSVDLTNMFPVCILIIGNWYKDNACLEENFCTKTLVTPLTVIPVNNALIGSRIKFDKTKLEKEVALALTASIII